MGNRTARTATIVFAVVVAAIIVGVLMLAQSG